MSPKPRTLAGVVDAGAATACQQAGADPAACQKAADGDYHGAATDIGASGGAAACIAAGAPEAAPACSFVGGEVAGKIYDGAKSLFGGDTCPDDVWVCTIPAWQTTRQAVVAALASDPFFYLPKAAAEPAACPEGLEWDPITQKCNQCATPTGKIVPCGQASAPSHSSPDDGNAVMIDSHEWPSADIADLDYIVQQLAASATYGEDPDAPLPGNAPAGTLRGALMSALYVRAAAKQPLVASEQVDTSTAVDGGTPSSGASGAASFLLQLEQQQQTSTKKKTRWGLIAGGIVGLGAAAYVGLRLYQKKPVVPESFQRRVRGWVG